MPSTDFLCMQLKARGRRVTPQRRAIIQVLVENGSHPSAEQVFARVRQVLPDMSPATVYNTLHELAEIGTLLELDVGLGERRYDVTTANHAHLVCQGCGRVEDADCDCEALEVTPEQVHGFQILCCSVIFHGYCTACTESRSRN